MVLRAFGCTPRRKFFDTLADNRLVKYTPFASNGVDKWRCPGAVAPRRGGDLTMLVAERLYPERSPWTRCLFPIAIQFPKLDVAGSIQLFRSWYTAGRSVFLRFLITFNGSCVTPLNHWPVAATCQACGLLLHPQT